MNAAPRATGLPPGLVATASCPVCGGAGRERSDDMASQRGEALQGRLYLKPAVAAVGITLDEFVALAETWRCTHCGNFYCDPWFAPEVVTRLFCSLTPDHLFAWGHFENWLHRDPPKRSATESLYEVVTKRVGPIGDYAEFTCPFQGFLQLFRGAEAGPRERLRLFSRALSRPRDPRWSSITRLYEFVARLDGWLMVQALRLRGLAVRLRGGNRAPGLDPVALPRRRYLLTRDTSVGWGSNCVRYGGSCRYFAQKVLGAEVLPFDEADRRAPGRFHVLGIFNSLDHTTYPLEVLRRAVAIADHVLLVTHHATLAGKQHWYALGDDFPGWLRGALPGIAVTDLRREVAGDDRSCNYILLSRQPEKR